MSCSHDARKCVKGNPTNRLGHCATIQAAPKESRFVINTKWSITGVCLRRMGYVVNDLLLGQFRCCTVRLLQIKDSYHKLSTNFTTSLCFWSTSTLDQDMRHRSELLLTPQHRKLHSYPPLTAKLSYRRKSTALVSPSVRRRTPAATNASASGGRVGLRRGQRYQILPA